MAVIDEIYVKDKDNNRLAIDSYDNTVIDEIVVNGESYHFAKENSVSGTNKIVCDDVVAEPLINCVISGNSLQDGTPTPDAPVEIVSVGDKSVNLIDYTTFKSGTSITGFKYEYEGDGVFHIYGEHNPSKTTATSFNSGYFALDIPVEDVDSYYSTCAEVIEGTSGNLNTYFFTGVKNDASSTGVQLANAPIPAKSATGYKKHTPVKPSAKVENATKIYRAWLYFTWSSSNPLEYLDYRIRVWFYKGYDSASSYEPYGKYKIPVVQRGLHIVNPMGFVGNALSYNADDKTYTLKWDIDRFSAYNKDCSVIPVGSKIYIGVKWIDNYTNKEQINVMVYYTDNTQGYFTIGKTWVSNITVAKPIRDISLYFNNSSESKGCWVKFKDLIVGWQDEFTQYEPYIEPVTTNIFLDEPLRKMGDYADYIDFKENKVVRNIKEVVFKGGEITNQVNSYLSIGYIMWRTNYNYTDANYDAYFGKYLDTYPELSSHFIGYGEKYAGMSTAQINKWYVNSMYRIVFNLPIEYAASDGVQATMADINNWLANQYENGTPVTFDYILKEPIEEPLNIDLPQLPAQTTIVEIDTQLAPDSFNIDYWKQIRG